MKRKTWTEVRKVGAGWSGLGTTYSAKDGERVARVVQGVVAMKHGFVNVYATQHYVVPDYTHSNFQFIWKGKKYEIQYPQCFTDRGLAIVARRFANEIANR